MKGYSKFPKASALREARHHIVKYYIQDTSWWGSYLATEVQSVYSTAPADKAIKTLI